MCGVGVCVWARVSAAPRHSWLGCWAVCVLRLHPVTPGTSARCGCVCFGSGFCCAPPLLAGVLGLCVCSACTQPLLATGARRGCVCLGSGFGCAPALMAGVLGCVCAPLAPSHSWQGCAVWVCVFGLRFGCGPPLLAGVLGCVCAPLAPSHSWPRVRGVGVCVWAWVSAAPRHSWLGCRAVCVLRLHPATPGHGCAVWVCVFGLGFRLRPATPGWGVGLCVRSACTQPLLATVARCGCVCLGSGFGCAPPLLAGVLGCVCAPVAPSHSWPRVRGVDVCVWARVSAAPRHSWLGCWAVCVVRLHPASPGGGCAVWVCVFGLGFRLRPATPRWGVGLCACSACTQPLLARVHGVGVCVWARVSAVPRHSWPGCWAVCVLRLHPATPGHGCAVWVCVFGLGFRLRPATPRWGVGLCACSACTQPLLARVHGVGVCVRARVSAAPRHSWLGSWAVCVLRLHPATPGTGARCGCVCLGSGFRCAPPLLAGVLGCVCAPLAPSHSWLCVSLGAVLCVPCPLRSVRCCASLCWCACAVLFVWCVLLLGPGAVVRCRVLCCFLLVCCGAVLGLVARGCLLVPCCGALLSVLLCWCCAFVSFPCVCGAVLRCASCCSVPVASALLFVPRAVACPCVLCQRRCYQRAKAGMSTHGYR